MPEVYFQNLSAVLCRYLADARNRIRIAVCWFSHRDIFETLLKKLRAGISVELLLEYDSQNIHPNGLDFQKFIKLGGSLYAYRDTALMHHKFALLDDRLLLTGSFNWTYSSNAENLIATENPVLLSSFQQEFSRLKGLSVHIWKIRPAEVKVFASFPLFQNTQIQRTDLRRRISSGAGVWWARLQEKNEAWEPYFRMHHLPLNPQEILRPYWAAYRLWDTDLFDEMWPLLAAEAAAARAKGVRALARRAQTGEIVLAISGKMQLYGLGIIQSDPKSDPATGTSYREVQWLRTFAEEPLLMPEELPVGIAGKFRGSALKMVEVVFEHEGH